MLQSAGTERLYDGVYPHSCATYFHDGREFLNNGCSPVQEHSCRGLDAVAAALSKVRAGVEGDLQGRARFIPTDSGGISEGNVLLHVPCITLRKETEWTGTLPSGQERFRYRCNVLTGADRRNVLQALENIVEIGPWGVNYSGGEAGEIILRALDRDQRS
jgi:hypothetical protein